MNWDMLKTGAVDAAFTGWWSDEMHGAADVHGFAGARHADDGAKAVPGSVIGRERGRGEEDDWDLLEAFVHFHDGAEILAADVLTFGFDDERGGNFDLDANAMPAQAISWESSWRTIGACPRNEGIRSRWNARAARRNW